MNVLEIIKVYLKEKEYDGLVDEFGECACGLSDLAPCGHMSENCEAGWKGPCNCGAGCGWHITTNKRNRFRKKRREVIR